MKLARISLNAKVQEGKYRLTVPPHINEKLVSYQTLYREVYHEDLPVETMMLAMIEQFLESDAEFRSWKRERDGQGTTMPDSMAGKRGPKTPKQAHPAAADVRNHTPELTAPTASAISG